MRNWQSGLWRREREVASPQETPLDDPFLNQGAFWARSLRAQPSNAQLRYSSLEVRLLNSAVCSVRSPYYQSHF